MPECRGSDPSFPAEPAGLAGKPSTGDGSAAVSDERDLVRVETRYLCSRDSAGRSEASAAIDLRSTSEASEICVRWILSDGVVTLLSRHPCHDRFRQRRSCKVGGHSSDVFLTSLRPEEASLGSSANSLAPDRHGRDDRNHRCREPA